MRSDGRRLTRDQGTGGGKIGRRRWHKGKAKASLSVFGTRAGHVRKPFPFSVVLSVIPNRLTAEMPPTFLEKGTRAQYEALLDKYDTWLFDCDGVLWNGDRLVDGAKEVLGMLRRQSARTILSG